MGSFNFSSKPESAPVYTKTQNRIFYFELKRKKRKTNFEKRTHPELSKAKLKLY